nr:hypothetical protein [uncultured Dongia sp.]
MASPALGPIYRNLADIMKNTAAEITKEVDKLRRKIRARLPKKMGDRFDTEWKNASNTKGRRRAAAKVLAKVITAIEDSGEAVNPDFAGAESELLTLIDMLRTLEDMENAGKHFDDMAKAYGS